MKGIVRLLFVFLLLGNYSFPVYAVSIQELQAELNQLKAINEAQSINLAKAINQIQEIVAEFQGLHGQVDQSLHINELQEKAYKDQQQSISVLEEKVVLLTQQLEELKATGLLPSSQVKRLNEFVEFEKALSLLNMENYKGASLAFNSFLKAYPKSPYIENVLYWIGENLYLMKDYTASIVGFQKVITEFPMSSKVPSALLKQGYAFYEMKSFEEAKAFLNKLITKYPRSREAIQAQIRIKEIEDLLAPKSKEALKNEV